MKPTVRVVESLAAFDDQALDRVCSEASIFFDRAWFRMLDDMDLGEILHSGWARRYIVAVDTSGPLALCPVLVVRGDASYFLYSFEKYYFTGWQAELGRLAPRLRPWLPQIAALVRGYRNLVRWAGADTSGWVLALSPLSFRGDVALAPATESAQAGARDAVLEALEEMAREEGLPLCFYGVEQRQEPLRATLRARGFHEVYLFSDNLLTLPSGDLNDYLKRFPKGKRKSLKHEMRRLERRQIRFERTAALAEWGPRLSQLYDQTCRKYGDDYLRMPPSCWPLLQRHLGPRAEAIIARRGDAPVGFSLLLHKRDLWGYRVGRSDGGEPAAESSYFGLAYYEPIRRALELGCAHLWLGPNGWRTKRHRGAMTHHLYNYFWFPRRWSGNVILPYLKLFARATRAAGG
jgi:predicted N-acyltransferase